MTGYERSLHWKVGAPTKPSNGPIILCNLTAVTLSSFHILGINTHGQSLNVKYILFPGGVQVASNQEALFSLRDYTPESVSFIVYKWGILILIHFSSPQN